MKRYELGLVVKPNLSETEVNGLIERMKATVGEQGGSVEAVDLWGKRRLTYPVEKYTEGYYIFIRFLLSPLRVEEVSRVARLTEEVLRHIVVKETKKHHVIGQDPGGKEIGEASSDNVTSDVQTQSE